MHLCEGPTLDLCTSSLEKNIYIFIREKRKKHTPRVKTTTTTATATYNREKNKTRSNHIHIWTRCIQPYSRNALYKYTKIYIKHSIKSSIFMMLLMCNDDMKWCCGDDGRWLWNVSNDSCWLRFLCILHFYYCYFSLCVRDKSLQFKIHCIYQL